MLWVWWAGVVVRARRSDRNADTPTRGCDSAPGSWQAPPLGSLVLTASLSAPGQMVTAGERCGRCGGNEAAPSACNACVCVSMGKEGPRAGREPICARVRVGAGSTWCAGACSQGLRVARGQWSAGPGRVRRDWGVERGCVSGWCGLPRGVDR
ncbi:hypothetical protein BC834DRAFT_895607 [Gloeopeniophorella convolvens]|nr:hypothetical protein BC834DRAFT_895607 [Gloeopeniophorella convolvens]